MQDDSYTHLILIFLLTIIAANLFILDLKVFSPNTAILVSQVAISATPVPTIPAGQKDVTYSFCPQSCLSLIENATRSANQNQKFYNQVSTTTNASRESYIPLGTCSTDKSSFTDLTSTETVIDPANYGTVKEAYFIASLKNPTRNGQVEAQLYNITDKHPVWGSTVILNGAESQTISSGKITLDTGSKLYRVQLKSTLNYTVTLDNSKIRIISE